MQILAEARILHPRAVVFDVYRDHLVELAEFLPNIREIKVLSREEKDGEVRFVNEWKGGGDIPAVARSVLSESMLGWTDRATWFSRDFRVEWSTDIHAFPGAVKSSGTNLFHEAPGGTRFELRGQFSIDASKVPGVPRLLAKSIGGAIEKFMVAQIVKNTEETAAGIAKLIAKLAAAPPPTA